MRIDGLSMAMLLGVRSTITSAFFAPQSRRLAQRPLIPGDPEREMEQLRHRKVCR